MPDAEAFDDLVALKRRFRAAEAEIAEFSKTLPLPTAIASGDAGLTATQRDTWKALWDQHTDLALKILAHRAFDGLSGPERVELDEAATKAAKAAA